MFIAKSMLHDAWKYSKEHIWWFWWVLIDLRINLSHFSDDKSFSDQKSKMAAKIQDGAQKFWEVSTEILDIPKM